MLPFSALTAGGNPALIFLELLQGLKGKVNNFARGFAEQKSCFADCRRSRLLNL
jgi:hypothetical protein